MKSQPLFAGRKEDLQIGNSFGVGDGYEDYSRGEFGDIGGGGVVNAHKERPCALYSAGDVGGGPVVYIFLREHGQSGVPDIFRI